MAVLSMPVNMSFEIAPDKVEAFFKNKNMAQKAIERSAKHFCKAEKRITKNGKEVNGQNDKYQRKNMKGGD